MTLTVRLMGSTGEGRYGCRRNPRQVFTRSSRAVRSVVPTQLSVGAGKSVCGPGGVVPVLPRSVQ